MEPSETTSLLPAIIGLIMLICFFVMTANISGIKNDIRKAISSGAGSGGGSASSGSYSDHYKRGEFLEYLDKPKEAMDAYKESHYAYQKFMMRATAKGGIFANGISEHEQKNEKMIKDKIIALGGQPKVINA